MNPQSYHSLALHTVHEDTTRFVYRKYNFWRLKSLNNPIFSKEGYRLLSQSTEKFYEELEKHRFSLITYHVLSTIVPTEEEMKIFNFLMEMQAWCKQQLESHPDKESENYRLKSLVSNTIPRVAGGWCRDKLLGMESDDMDIALDNVDGEQYSTIILEYQKFMGYEIRTIGVIQENPDQSKHLKTATTHIFGIAVDFVNLRCEEYGTNSRIPTANFGTATEDAYRRDLTINTLFYNIVTNEIEDFVGCGLSDLKNGIIRTPLPSYKTFLDDPLRIIRSVRMAARFHFLIGDEIVDACRNDEIRDALHSKISRERVGSEFSKILKNGDPVGAFASLREMNITDIIFTIVPTPKKSRKSTFEYVNPTPLKWSDREWENALYRMRICHLLTKSVEIDSRLRMALHMAAFLSPIAPKSENGMIINDWVDSLIMSSWRLPKKFSSQISQIIILSRIVHPYIINKKIQHMGVEEIRKYYQKILVEEKVALGKWLRMCNEDYHAVVTLASVLHTTGIEGEEMPILDGKLFHSEIFLEVLSTDILMEIQAMSMLLTGKELMSLLGITRGGSFMMKVMDSFLEWQIQAWPCTKDDAINFVKENVDNLLTQK